MQCNAVDDDDHGDDQDDDGDGDDDVADGSHCGGNKNRGQRTAGALRVVSLQLIEQTFCHTGITSVFKNPPNWLPEEVGMTDASDGCRNFSSRTKAPGLSSISST